MAIFDGAKNVKGKVCLQHKSIYAAYVGYVLYRARLKWNICMVHGGYVEKLVNFNICEYVHIHSAACKLAP